MKRVVFILLCALLADVAYAQTDMRRVERGVEAAVEKAVREHNAKQKKAKEEAERKEREKARRHEQQRRQHEANYNRQMNNLNQVSASDFMNPPQQQGGNFSTKVNKFRENQQTPNIVATSKKENGNRTNADPFANSGRIGSASWSGNNYRGNLYDNKRAGFGNTQQRQQVRVPANQIRGQYKPNRNMRQGVVNLQRTNAVPKAKVQRTLQQGNIAQSSQQQRGAQVVRNVQVPQKQQAPVQREKVAWVEGGVKYLDTSKPIYITLQQNNSSPDLAMVDTRRIDYATKIGNITVYNMPNEAPRPPKAPTSKDIKNEAPYLSDIDDKRPSSITSNQAVKKSGSGRSQEEQYILMRKDAASGFKSFENSQEWEHVYGVANAGTVTVKRIVIKKR